MSKYKVAVIQGLEVGDENAQSIVQLVEKTQPSLDIDQDSYRRAIARVLDGLIVDYPEELIMMGGGRGSKKRYYWASQESKSEAYEAYRPEFTSFPHAMAMSFIGDHFEQFLPPDYMDEIQEDIDLAWSFIASREEYRDRSQELNMKLTFEPSGYQILPVESPNSPDKRLVYKALNSDKVFTAKYDSIHKLVPKKITVSPQRISYLNHQVLVLAYIHEIEQVKYIELSRLQNVSLSPLGVSFEKVDLKSFVSTHRLKLRAHTWVKNYFASVKLGDGKRAKFKKESADIWLIEVDITLPRHFNNPDKPDPFFFANFLGMFSTSVEVLAPQCLREEMINRADDFANIYLKSKNASGIIEYSPVKMSNK